LEVLYNNYSINVKLGMKRNDWLSLVSSTQIEDDVTIFRNDTEVPQPCAFFKHRYLGNL